ncbi:MAG: hypothetical protein JRI34_03485 [Deltaproteobacteria bacterium]|nr:hypothetical protein [Deltaproteobacteria bacterium]
MLGRKIRRNQFFVGLILCALLWLSFSCATGPARQMPEERSILQTPLVEGEEILQANSCGRLPKASIWAGRKSKFGSCFLTNLRFIYEESKWFRTLETVSKFVPSSGDFGIMTVLTGTAKALHANYLIQLGKEGRLKAVKREGRVIIPLSDIKNITVVKGFCLTANCDRWISIQTHLDKPFIFEVYNYPPDKSGVLPASRFISRSWKEAIEKARDKTFGPNRL